MSNGTRRSCLGEKNEYKKSRETVPLRRTYTCSISFLVSYSSPSILPEALFLDVVMECHHPQTGVKTEVCHVYLYLDTFIFTHVPIWCKHLNIGRHEPLTFRLPFGGPAAHEYTSKITASDVLRIVPDVRIIFFYSCF